MGLGRMGGGGVASQRGRFRSPVHGTNELFDFIKLGTTGDSAARENRENFPGSAYAE